MEIDFKGTGVAMVTPFNEDKALDYIGLSNLIEYLIDGGVEFLVSMGTTGESTVLTNDEKQKIVTFTKNEINGRVPFVLGIGGNNTSNVVTQINLLIFLVLMPFYLFHLHTISQLRRVFINILRLFLKSARLILYFIMFLEEHLQTCLLSQH